MIQINKLLITITIITMLSIPAFAIETDAQVDISLDALNAKAYGLYLKKQYDESINLYIKAAQMHNNYAPFYDGLGLVYLAQKKYHQAITHFNKAIKLDSKNSLYKIHKLKAELTNKKDHIYTANNLFYKATYYSKDLSIIENINDKNNNNYKNLKYITDIYKKTENKNILIANKAKKNKEFDKAIDHYLLAADSGTTKHRAYNNLGVLYFELNDIKQAEHFLSKALSYNKKAAYIYNNLGVLYANKEDYIQANENFNKALKLYHSYSSTYNNKAVSAIKEQLHIEENIKDLQKIRKKDPDNIAAKQLLSEYYILDKNYEGCINELEDTVKTVNYNPFLIKIYANALYLNGNYDKALLAYKNALEINTKDSYSLLQTAKCEDKLNLTKEAYQTYKKALKVNSYNSSIYLSFGNYLLKQNQFNEAKKYLKIYTQKVPYSAESVLTDRLLKENL